MDILKIWLQGTTEQREVETLTNKIATWQKIIAFLLHGNFFKNGKTETYNKKQTMRNGTRVLQQKMRCGATEVAFLLSF